MQFFFNLKHKSGKKLLQTASFSGIVYYARNRENMNRLKETVCLFFFLLRIEILTEHQKRHVPNIFFFNNLVYLRMFNKLSLYFVFF